MVSRKLWPYLLSGMIGGGRERSGIDSGSTLAESGVERGRLTGACTEAEADDERSTLKSWLYRGSQRGRSALGQGSAGDN